MNGNIQLIAPELLFSFVEEQLACRRDASFTVTGNSMWPFICHGRDQVIVSACDSNQLCIGDIILFQTLSGKYILHRITALRPDAFETTGDGNCYRDGWFPRNCVRARVVKIIRKKKKIDCNSLLWKTVFFLWRKLFPFRRYLLDLLLYIGRYKGRIRAWRRKRK